MDAVAFAVTTDADAVAFWDARTIATVSISLAVGAEHGEISALTSEVRFDAAGETSASPIQIVANHQ